MTTKVWRGIAYHVGRFIGGMLMAASRRDNVARPQWRAFRRVWRAAPACCPAGRTTCRAVPSPRGCMPSGWKKPATTLAPKRPVAKRWTSNRSTAGRITPTAHSIPSTTGTRSWPTWAPGVMIGWRNCVSPSPLPTPEHWPRSAIDAASSPG